MRLLYLFESCGKVVDEVVGMLYADAESYCRRTYVSLGEFLLVHLRVRCRGRMYHKAFGIGHVGKQREESEIIAEAPRGFFATVDFKRENAAASVRKIFFVQLVVAVRRQSRMTYALHLGMPAQIFDNLDSVGYVSLNAQRKRFEALEQQKGVEGRYTGAFVAEYHGADTVDKSCFGRYFGKNGSVVVGVGLGECGETAGEAEVIEIAAVDNDASER